MSESCVASARLFTLQDVTPSLNVYCKHTRIKQYLKENRALRTETTINNTYDFGIGRKPRNLLMLLEVGFAGTRAWGGGPRNIYRASLDCACKLREYTVRRPSGRAASVAWKMVWRSCRHEGFG